MRKNAYEALLSRRNPDQRHIKEAFARLQEDSSIKYLAGAMEEVDPEYTGTSLAEGERVWNQIEKGLERSSRNADHRFQGSTMKNTHIKAHSDLDLLVIEARYVELEHPQIPKNPYQGNPTDDLRGIRRICKETLTDAFPAATVDDSGRFSVKLSGGSLRRIVDVVASAWWNTNAYAQYGHEFFRGVEILNSHTSVRETDSPFYHAKLMELKDDKTRGNTKKLVRLLKTLRADSEGEVTMSSFDMEAIIYTMSEDQLQGSEEMEVQTAKTCFDWLVYIENNTTFRESMNVPDAKRKIFAPGKATLAQLTAVRKELGELLRQIEQGLTRSFRKLAEARLKWPREPFYPR